MKKLIITSLTMLYLHAMPPPIPELYLDDAYKAYKTHNYKKAFKLYKNAVEAVEYSNNKNANFKAYYNLANFYYQGLGVKKNRVKAALYFYKAYEIFKDDIYKFNSFCHNKMMPYYKKALHKLYILEDNYRYESKKHDLENNCKRYK